MLNICLEDIQLRVNNFLTISSERITKYYEKQSKYSVPIYPFSTKKSRFISQEQSAHHFTGFQW